MTKLSLLLDGFNRMHAPRGVFISDLSSIASDTTLISALVLIRKYCVNVICTPDLRIQESAETLLRFVEANKHKNTPEGDFVEFLIPCGG